MTCALNTVPPFAGAYIPRGTLISRLHDVQRALDNGEVPTDAADVYRDDDGRVVFSSPELVLRRPTMVATHQRVVNLLDRLEGNTLADAVAREEKIAVREQLSSDRWDNRVLGKPFVGALGLTGTVLGGLAAAASGSPLAYAGLAAGAVLFGGCLATAAMGWRASSAAQHALDRVSWTKTWAAELDAAGSRPAGPSIAEQLRALPIDEKRQLAADLLDQVRAAERAPSVVAADQQVVVGGVVLPVRRS